MNISMMSKLKTKLFIKYNNLLEKLNFYKTKNSEL